MPSNWVTMYDVQLRYRNAAFAHVARTLGDQYGPAWFEDQIVPLFTDREWQELEKNVPERYAKAGLDIPLPERFEWLGVAHLTNIVQKHGRYLIDGARSLQPQPRERKIDSVVTICRQVRAARDPVAHPPIDELSLRDLAFYTVLAQRVLEELGLHESAAELDDVLIENEKPRSIQIPAEIPPPSLIVNDFIGRSDERQVLDEWFGSDDEPVRVIAGGGGTGKSALAYQAALDQTSLSITRLNFIIWMTAKQRRLSGGKIVPIDADFYDDSDVLNILWAFFGGEGDPDMTTLMELMTDTPGLIVADDIDSLSGEGGERAKALLTRTIPYRTQTKVLATSRRQLFGLENVTMTLSGFSESETGAFVRARYQDQDVPIEFTSAQVSAVRGVTDGIPLYIEDLLRFIQTLDFDRALRQWTDSGGQEPRAYALRREFEEMADDAKRILLAAARMARPVSAYDMATLLSIGDERVLSAIEELRNLFFMSRPSYVEGVPRFTVGATTALLVDDVMQGTYEYEQICRAVEYYEKQATVSGYERGRVGEVHRTVRLLIERGEFEEAERVLDQALAELPSNPDLIGSRGYLFKHWSPPRLVDADTAFSLAADLHSRNPFVYWEWADLHMAQKDYGSASSAAERGLQECGAHPQLLRIAGAARRDLGHRLARNLAQGRSVEEYRLARAHFRKMLESNDKADPRYHVSFRDFYFLNIMLLDRMAQVDASEDYRSGIRELALEWRRVEPTSDEPDRWLA